MNNLNMINRRVHGQWSCGWKYKKENDWSNRAGLYVNNFYGEELLLTFSPRSKTCTVFEVNADLNDIYLKPLVEIKTLGDFAEWLKSEIPCSRGQSFDEGCWMEQALRDIGWKS